MKNKNRKDRYNLTVHVSRQIYEDFYDVCRKLGLASRSSRGNIVLEGFMVWFIENFKSSPTYVQTTLFYKPQINFQQKIEVNIAQKLELKMLKNDLKAIIDSLEKGKGERQFYLSRLKEVLPKAIRLYQRMPDEEVKRLFEKAEKWI